MGTNFNSLTPEVRQKLALKAVFEARRSLMYPKFGRVEKLSNREGDTVKFFNYGVMSYSTEVAANTLLPSGEILADKLSWEAPLSEYANGIYILKRDLDMRKDNTRNGLMKVVGKAMGQTLDYQVATRMLTQGAAYNASGVAVSGIVATASASELNGIAQYLDTHEVGKVTEFVKPEDGYKTTPVRPCYVGLVPADCKADIMALDGFEHSETYRNNGELLDENEFGRIGDIRFVKVPNYLVSTGAGGSSSDVRNTGGKADVYTIVIIGEDAYGVVPFDANLKRTDEDYEAEIIVTTNPDKADPWGRYATFGFRMNIGSVVFTGLSSGERLVCYRVAASKSNITPVVPS